MKTKKKKFKLFDAVLSTICITLVVESVAPTAAIGNQQYFWWILLIAGFCVPYGMITAELGTAYPSEGGLYDWVKLAFGKKWAGRVAWNYWINFPLWIASLASAITTVVMGIFGIELSIVWLLVIQLGYTWLVCILGNLRVTDTKELVNLGTVFKVVLALGLGALGIYTFFKTGESANPITGVADLFPSLDLAGMSFVSIIIFNFLGFEVVASFVEDMENPKKEIPKALVVGGALMALFYVLPATGINVAMSMEDAEVAGITDSFAILLGNLGVNEMTVKAVVIVAGLMFIYTMIANITSWSFGVNSVAKYAADDGSLPKVFSKTNKDGVPNWASYMNGIVASLICIGGIIAGEISDTAVSNFELFFSLSWITLLISYIPMFLAFLKLRKTDTKTERVYKVPGSEGVLKLITYLPFTLLVLGIIFTLFGDFTMDYLLGNIPLLIGVAISLIIQEVLVARIKSKK